MTTNSATAGWEQVEDKYYRKILQYSSLWDADFDLSDYIVAGAPYGGALGGFTLHSGLSVERGRQKGGRGEK